MPPPLPQNFDQAWQRVQRPRVGALGRWAHTRDLTVHAADEHVIEKQLLEHVSIELQRRWRYWLKWGRLLGFLACFVIYLATLLWVFEPGLAFRVTTAIEAAALTGRAAAVWTVGGVHDWVEQFVDSTWAAPRYGAVGAERWAVGVGGARMGERENQLSKRSQKVQLDSHPRMDPHISS